MHRAPSGKAVNWPHSMGINAKALICSRLMIRALGLILGGELSFSDWQPELFITQPESQSSALQATNQSQALSVGKEWKQVWNGQQQFAKMKPNFCPSPPAHPGAAPPGSQASAEDNFPEGWKSQQFQGSPRSFRDTKLFHSNRKHKKKRNSTKTTAMLSKRQQEDKGVQQQVAAGIPVPYLRGILEDNEHPPQVPQHPRVLAWTHQHGYKCLSHFLAWNFVSEH